MSTKQKTAFADRKMLGRAIKDSFVKLSPKTQAKNPVMFLVFVAAILTSILWVVSLFGLKDAPSGYTLAIAVILWFTVLFANFAEAIAEGRGKAQADSLRASRKDVDAHKIPSVSEKDSVTVVPSALLKKGELVIVKAGEQIPADGEVVEGAASVDESAITGESAPVIREAGGDRSAVTGGTTVLSDWIVVRVTNEAGESFLDKMIAMVEGAARKKTPNEIALQIFLVALSIIFILVTVSLYTYSIFSAKLAGIENPTSVTTLVALLVSIRNLITTTLKTNDYRYVVAPSGSTAIMEATSHHPEIILLDLGLPDMDGVQVIQTVRAWSNTPIIVISARSEDNDKIHALDAGADDYLTKPFSVEELLARLRVTQRRLSLMTAEMFTASSVFVNGKLKVDYAGGCAYLDENELHLTPIEYKLLCLLSKNVGKVLTHTFITQNIWGRSWDNDVASLRVFMATLRKKLEPTEESPQYIQTHIGVGYRMMKIE